MGKQDSQRHDNNILQHTRLYGRKLEEGEAYNYTNITTANTQVYIYLIATCGLATNATTITFGNLTAGQTADEQAVLVNNTGTITTDVSINGTHWYNASNTFAVSYTRYANTTGLAYGSKTPLTLAIQDIYNNLASNGATFPAALQVAVPLGQPAGAYTQNVTFTSVC